MLIKGPFSQAREPKKTRKPMNELTAKLAKELAEQLLRNLKEGGDVSKWQNAKQLLDEYTKAKNND
jgi:hypothetical protein